MTEVHNAIKAAVRSTDNRARRLRCWFVYTELASKASALTRAATSAETLQNYFPKLYINMTVSYLNTSVFKHLRDVLFLTIRP